MVLEEPQEAISNASDKMVKSFRVVVRKDPLGFPFVSFIMSPLCSRIVVKGYHRHAHAINMRKTPSFSP